MLNWLIWQGCEPSATKLSIISRGGGILITLNHILEYLHNQAYEKNNYEVVYIWEDQIICSKKMYTLTWLQPVHDLTITFYRTVYIEMIPRKNIETDKNYIW